MFDDNGLDGVVSGVKTLTLYGVDVMYHMLPGSAQTRQPVTFKIFFNDNVDELLLIFY